MISLLFKKKRKIDPIPSFFVFILIGLSLSLIFFLTFKYMSHNIEEQQVQNEVILPQPVKDSDFSLEKAIESRRSQRSYKNEPLTLAQISQLCWAAQGITDPQTGHRAVPSAGALYPIEIYIVNKYDAELPAGSYHYNNSENKLELIQSGDFSEQLQEFALNQSAVGNGAVNIIIAAVFSRVTDKYGDSGEQYVYAESGAVAQNIYLQAESLGLGTVYIGAFDENKIKDLLQIEDDIVPLVVMPVGIK